MIKSLMNFLDFLQLDKSTLRKEKPKKPIENIKEEKDEEILCKEQHYQLIEQSEIIKENDKEIEVKTITEIIPQGNQKALKKTRQEQNILRK